MKPELRVVSQQEQTKDFFNSYSNQWEASANKKDGIIQQRNNFVLNTAREHFPAGVNCSLDIGCGTGELVASLAEISKRAVGIDFAPSMINKCEELKLRQNLDNVVFEVADGLEFGAPDTYNIISANGFIEYISLAQLRDFAARAHELLKPNGVLCIGSRNRLFNLNTFNSFTSDEIKNGPNYLLMAEEAIALSADTWEIQNFAESISKVNYQDSKHMHPVTGVLVDQRFQYTPLQLSNLINHYNLKTVGLSGCNYHVLPLGSGVNDLVPPSSLRNTTIPFCSTFMIAFKKSAS